MPAGRPREWDDKRIELERLAFEKWFDDDPLAYSISKFAHSRGYDCDWIKELSEKTPKFTRSYKKGKQICQDRIAHGALTNAYNSPFAMFMLKCNYKWDDSSHMRSKDDDKTQDIHIHMPPVESSKEFPVPKKERVDE